ncbi:hypothetical protein BOTBODRAFT_624065 [Botryobasidium botryosum FD-172 SS1]|uniref:Protein ARV n=1 Tax=Botryobasidium botryosum (strain FD-172 SS1) TaxID=930990 RepID=A0A067MWN4_BOTB1|nr:hypothetical protein BOTBODRAFT_624065 [Botryobasidium botryosum FD-172 SS1]
MPICTSCTHPLPHLYTVYQSAHNLRLEQCSTCHAFADPYVEHDGLTLLLDLILLKPGVYRHLLFNRGVEPRKAVVTHEESAKDTESADEKAARGEGEKRWARWETTAELGSILILVDSFIRWSNLYPVMSSDSTIFKPWTQDAAESFSRIFLGCLLETVAFHGGVVCACALVLPVVDYIQRRRAKNWPSGTRQEFRFSHVPLTIFYSSITKLFLLLLLSVWRPTTTGAAVASSHYGVDFNRYPLVRRVYEYLDDDKLDREWVVRNALGGMAAGFGLRVVLDCHPVFTTIVILSGWMVKTGASGLVGTWVGGEERGWFEYFIP